jgi:hypothetical protein
MEMVRERKKMVESIIEDEEDPMSFINVEPPKV